MAILYSNNITDQQKNDIQQLFQQFSHPTFNRFKCRQKNRKRRGNFTRGAPNSFCLEYCI